MITYVMGMPVTISHETIVYEAENLADDYKHLAGQTRIRFYQYDQDIRVEQRVDALSHDPGSQRITVQEPRKNKAGDEYWSDMITVYRQREWGSKEYTVSINWPAIGASSIATTQHFVDMMRIGIYWAQMFEKGILFPVQVP